MFLNVLNSVKKILRENVKNTNKVYGGTNIVQTSQKIVCGIPYQYHFASKGRYMHNINARSQYNILPLR